MSLSIATLLIVSLAAVSAQQKPLYPRLIITPCGGSDNSLLSLREVNISPSPPVIPGTLDVKVKGSLNEDLPQLYIKATISKSFFGGTQKNTIPCISGYGSCVYDICELTKNLVSCPAEMQKYSLPCKCPFTKFNLDNFAGQYKVDNIPPLLSWLTDGDYEARAEIMTSPTGPVKACYDVKVSISNKAVDCTNPLVRYGPLCRGASGVVG